MSIIEMAYHRGTRDARMKFAAATPAGAPGSVVAPTGSALPGSLAATQKPGAPNQALGTSPVLDTGLAPKPTVKGLGMTETQGTGISGPPTTTTKGAEVYAPARPPKPARIPRQQSPVGSNNTTETVKSAPAAISAPQAPQQATNTTVATPTGSSAAPGGIIQATGSPAVDHAKHIAENLGTQTVAVSGGGK